MSITEFLELPEGKIAYDDTGSKSDQVIICVPGIGDLRQATRHLTPKLAQAGYRVINMDIRGHGESGTTFSSYTAATVGSDIVALLDHLDVHDAIILGNSAAGGSAVWAAAHSPLRIKSLLLCGPFVRDIPVNFVVKGILWACMYQSWGAGFWKVYYKTLFKAHPPPDLKQYAIKLHANLCEPGRLQALQAMMWASKADCESCIPQVRAKTVVLMGSQDPDFSDPAAEARHVAEALSGTVRMVNEAGHYPHVEDHAAVLEVLQELA
ncbi:Soluble epoxide hydrolase [Phaffia rhodozyma]|uniref:Soluble epoxide hydrolase n=1 Tax=Phaffia rhodozyma TaxID=264483 RepID=A0A0F7STW7_PHARH|nr:Soluble epoxide hydrolase [Phaffia rhodozyma]